MYMMLQKKQIFKLSVLREFLNDGNSCVSLVESTRLLSLPPCYLNDMKSGIFYLLNNTLKKYDRSLDGIVIGYQNVKILMDENTGVIPFGSAETQVNVSVEFYIFQPKIGNTLEGVINKKSDNHIGCLIHRYFNATILKPEDVEYEDWNCKDFDVNDKIIFKVKDLDFTGLLPYIEGIVRDEDLLDCVRSKKTGGCDLNVHRDFQSEVTENNGLRDDSLGSEMDESLASIIKQSVMNDLNKELKDVESNSNKKKKKKKKKEKDDNDEKLSELPVKKDEESALEKFLHSENEDDDFVKLVKSKKKKKKKDGERELKLNKNSESLTQHDELFYSTQLEPNSESKMNTTCSPIPKMASFATDNKPKTASAPSKAKKKERKRKAEDSGDALAAKKFKKDQSQMNGTMDFVDELIRRELNKVKKELNMFPNEKEEKERDDSLFEKLMKEVKNDMAPKKNKDSDSFSKKKKSIVQ